MSDLMEKIVSLSKRRGFIFPSSEIYGGLQGFWDFGPLGVELKNNIKKSWWKKFVQERGDVVGLDSVIIMNPKVWEKSGHVKGFADKLLECKKCHHRFRGEDISAVDGMGGGCPKCDSRDYEEEKEFNLMFDTYVGPVKDSASVAYLRPETAQGIFVNFENTVNSMRLKLPFGIAQIGKAFRNEITPGNFIFRSREFEQMELEYFVNPKEDEKWFALVKEKSIKQGIPIDSMIYLDAKWTVDNFNGDYYEELINEKIKTIKEDDKWLKSIKEKAIKKSIPLDSMLYLDAKWMIDNYGY